MKKVNHRSNLFHWVLISVGFSFLVTSFYLYNSKPKLNTQRGSLEQFTVPATLSLGHREFAWSLWALNGLATVVNAWQSKEMGSLEAEKNKQLEAKLNSFIKDLPEFSKEQLGMREIFIFPASYFAFVVGDTRSALETAKLGLEDERLAADLSLLVAYLTHLLTDDLNATALAYEKVLATFPSATWLKQPIALLKSGVDPFFVNEERRAKSCKLLSELFPFSEKILTRKKICPADLTNKGISE